jgi:hypothetical protein
MPWCDDCSRFYNPNSMPPDGTCPSCGAVLAPPDSGGSSSASRAPWHFKLLVAAAAVYLGWRAVQGVEWLLHHV